MIERLLKVMGRVPHDKALHFIAGSLLAAVGLPWGPWASLWTVVVVGFAKEVYDGTFGVRFGHEADLWDAVATILGGLPVWAALWVPRA